MDATNNHLSDLQDKLLLNYETQNPNTVHLYPQPVPNANGQLFKNKPYSLCLKLSVIHIFIRMNLHILAVVLGNMFPGQPGFKAISAPEHRISQQPPLSVTTYTTGLIQCQSYKGLVSSASLIGGIPVFLYLFARVSK